MEPITSPPEPGRTIIDGGAVESAGDQTDRMGVGESGGVVDDLVCLGHPGKVRPHGTEDTDTVGSVTGGLAGLKYGDIPEDWLSVIVRREEIEGLYGAFSQSFEEG